MAALIFLALFMTDLLRIPFRQNRNFLFFARLFIKKSFCFFIERDKYHFQTFQKNRHLY